jgi:hypothetical protein
LLPFVWGYSVLAEAVGVVECAAEEPSRLDAIHPVEWVEVSRADARGRVGAVVDVVPSGNHFKGLRALSLVLYLVSEDRVGVHVRVVCGRGVVAGAELPEALVKCKILLFADEDDLVGLAELMDDTHWCPVSVRSLRPRGAVADLREVLVTLERLADHEFTVGEPWAIEGDELHVLFPGAAVSRVAFRIYHAGFCRDVRHRIAAMGPDDITFEPMIVQYLFGGEGYSWRARRGLVVGIPRLIRFAVILRRG